MIVVVVAPEFIFILFFLVLWKATIDISVFYQEYTVFLLLIFTSRYEAFVSCIKKRKDDKSAHSHPVSISGNIRGF